MEEITKNIHELISLLYNSASFYGNPLIHPYTTEKFKRDLTLISANTTHILLLMEMYVGKIDSFSSAVQLLIGDNGFVVKRNQVAAKKREEKSSELVDDATDELHRMLNGAIELLAKTQISLTKKIQTYFS